MHDWPFVLCDRFNYQTCKNHVVSRKYEATGTLITDLGRIQKIFKGMMLRSKFVPFLPKKGKNEEPKMAKIEP